MCNRGAAGPASLSRKLPGVLLAFDYSGKFATLIYVLAGLLVLVTVLEKLFGWWGRLRRKLSRTSQAEGLQRQHDRRVLDAIRETLPRNLVTDFLRNHDFGGTWRRAWMTPITALAHRNDVEDRFLDEELEALRVELHAAVYDLSGLFNTDSWPDRNNHEWQDVGVRPEGPGRPHTELWERRQQQFNDTATRAADAYDALLEAARQKTLL
jgi:hypothetical protein